MLIEGEPGIGKTRLATEAARDAHAAGATVLYGRSDPESLVPFQPFAMALPTVDEHGALRVLRRRHPQARRAPDAAHPRRPALGGRRHHAPAPARARGPRPVRLLVLATTREPDLRAPTPHRAPHARRPRTARAVRVRRRARGAEAVHRGPQGAARAHRRQPVLRARDAAGSRACPTVSVTSSRAASRSSPSPPARRWRSPPSSAATSAWTCWRRSPTTRSKRSRRPPPRGLVKQGADRRPVPLRARAGARDARRADEQRPPDPPAPRHRRGPRAPPAGHVRGARPPLPRSPPPGPRPRVHVRAQGRARGRSRSRRHLLPPRAGAPPPAGPGARARRGGAADRRPGFPRHLRACRHPRP